MNITGNEPGNKPTPYGAKEEKMEIIFYASDDSMGNSTPEQCEGFREWAQRELENRFPDHNIDVSSERQPWTVFTDDMDDEQMINEYCSNLWDRYPGN